MIEIITALFTGFMLVLFPMLLLRVLRVESEEGVLWRIVAWSVLALFAWGFSFYLAFLAPLAGIIGILLGAIFVWRDSRKPRILSQESDIEVVSGETMSEESEEKNS